MAQNMRNFPEMNTNLRSFTDTDEDPLSQVETLKILSCPICRAVYIPSSQQQTDSQRSDALLETAFMGVCHLCFRCQRPACPQCWNPVHHACTSCTEEARLPFRSPVPSLEGLIFAPLITSPAARKINLSFTCLRNGRFYSPDPAPQTEVLEADQAALPARSSATTSDDLQAIQTAYTGPSSISAYPVWVQEVLGYKPGDPQDISSWRTNQGQGHFANEYGYAQANSPTASAQISPLDWPQLTQARPQGSVLVAENQEGEAEKQEDALESESISLLERIENILIIAISALLLLVGLTIVLAMTSTNMNSLFFHLLHIDIRTEISYILQLR